MPHAMEFVEFARRRPSPGPVTLLFGAETFLLRRGWEMIAEKAPEARRLRFDGDETPWERIRAELGAMMLGAPERLMGVRYRSVPRAALVKGIAAYAAEPAPRTWLVIELEEAKPPAGLQADGILWVHAGRPEPDMMRRWAAKEFRLRAVEPAPDAVDRLLSACERRPMSEVLSLIEIVSLFAADRKRVTGADVDVFVQPDLELTTFQLADAAAEGRGAEALDVARGLLDRDVPAPMILGALAWAARRCVEARRMSDAGENRFEITRALRLQYRADRFLATIRRHPAEVWAQFHREIMEADRRMKSGSTPEAAIESLVLRLSALTGTIHG